MSENFKYTIVYLPDEKVYGEVVSYGTYASKIRYSKMGIEYQVVVLNEDFDLVYEVNIPEIEEEF